MSTGVKGYRELTEFEEFAIEMKLKDEKEQIKKDRDIEIAKKLKIKNMSQDEISEITGLTLEEIENL